MGHIQKILPFVFEEISQGGSIRFIREIVHQNDVYTSLPMQVIQEGSVIREPGGQSMGTWLWQKKSLFTQQSCIEACFCSPCHSCVDDQRGQGKGIAIFFLRQGSPKSDMFLESPLFFKYQAIDIHLNRIGPSGRFWRPLF